MPDLSGTRIKGVNRKQQQLKLERNNDMARISCVMRILVFLCVMSMRILGADGSLEEEEADVQVLTPGKVEEADGWIVFPSPGKTVPSFSTSFVFL
jgi:hypothetical protein